LIFSCLYPTLSLAPDMSHPSKRSIALDL